MKDGHCPKCGSSDVFVSLAPFSRYSTRLPITAWSMAEREHYVCTSCGYVQVYISDSESLKKIAESWPRAGSPEAKKRRPPVFGPLGIIMMGIAAGFFLCIVLIFFFSK